MEIESGCDLEVGLLGEIRRQIINLPDKYVSSILGPVISYNGLMVMANHDSITIRTATIRVCPTLWEFPLSMSALILLVAGDGRVL